MAGNETAAGCWVCADLGPLLTAPGTSGRSWRCGECGMVWHNDHESVSA